MDIINVKSEILLFEISGAPKGTFHLATQYEYRCTAHHPRDKSFLTCISDTLWNFFNDSTVRFKIEVHFQFDNGGKKPRADLLIDLANLANTLMNQLLALHLEVKTDLGVLEISPIDQEETLSVLEECVLLAYPEN